ncbi:hypothetical protein FKM82_026340 [Ascaphus truei]
MRGPACCSVCVPGLCFSPVLGGIYPAPSDGTDLSVPSHKKYQGALSRPDGKTLSMRGADPSLLTLPRHLSFSRDTHSDSRGASPSQSAENDSHQPMKTQNDTTDVAVMVNGDCAHAADVDNAVSAGDATSSPPPFSGSAGSDSASETSPAQPTATTPTSEGLPPG